MPQFFLDRTLAPGTDVEISGTDARHIAQSLRLCEGDWLHLSDGAGHTFRAILTAVSPSRVIARIEEEITQRPAAPAPVLALALAKRTRFEWAIEKAVELGCRRILPFSSSRTVVRPRDAAAKTMRWQGIVLAAAKQSGLPFRPQIETPITFDALVARFPEFTRCILLYEGERKRALAAALASPPGAAQEALLVIGPEGGFSSSEVDAARAAGALTVGLGPQILRVETAAIAAIAIWQYERGNMHPEKSGTHTR